MRRPTTRTLLAALLITTLAGTLAACAGKDDPSASASTGTTLGPAEPTEQVPPSPSTAASSPAPAVSPSPTAAAPGGGSGTPHSTIASKAGYVWNHNSSGSYTATSAYQFNSGGGPINIVYGGTGSYTVVFGGLGDSGGVAHVQAYGASSNYCSVMSWLKTGSDESVAVRCYNASGAAADTTFVANYAVGSQAGARFSYLWADDPTATGTYQPSAAYRYDAVNSSGITVRPTATGRYDVYLPAAGPELSDPWTFQVTAYGTAALCKVAGFTAASRKVQVACRNAAGSAMHSRFSLSFSSEGSFVGRGDRRYGEYTGASDGVANPGPGIYTVRAAELGEARGQVVATATGTSSTYCHVRNWQPDGGDLAMTVVCFNPGGAAASSAFTLGVTW